MRLPRWACGRMDAGTRPRTRGAATAGGPRVRGFRGLSPWSDRGDRDRGDRDRNSPDRGDQDRGDRYRSNRYRSDQDRRTREERSGAMRVPSAFSGFGLSRLGEGTGSRTADSRTSDSQTCDSQVADYVPRVWPKPIRVVREAFRSHPWWSDTLLALGIVVVSVFDTTFHPTPSAGGMGASAGFTLAAGVVQGAAL